MANTEINKWDSFIVRSDLKKTDEVMGLRVMSRGGGVTHWGGLWNKRVDGLLVA